MTKCMRLLNSAARIDLFRRAVRDVTRLTKFVDVYSRGNGKNRFRDISNAIDEIARAPRLRPIGYTRPSNGLELRRWNVRQFAIIYSYERPSNKEPRGVVRIRAVRHSRVRNVFGWVREN